MSDPQFVAPGWRLFGRIDTPALVSRCVDALLALQPAARAVAISGDLFDQGNAEEYAPLRALLAPLAQPGCLQAPPVTEPSSCERSMPHLHRN